MSLEINTDPADQNQQVDQQTAAQAVNAVNQRIQHCAHDHFLNTKEHVGVFETTTGVVAQKGTDFHSSIRTGVFISKEASGDGTRSIIYNSGDNTTNIRAVRQFVLISQNLTNLRMNAGGSGDETFPIINEKLYVLAKTNNGVVLQSEQDYNESKRSGLYIPNDNKQPIVFDGNEDIINYLKELPQPEAVQGQAAEQQITPILENFTSAKTIQEQREAHQQSKEYMKNELEAIGAEVAFISPRSQLPNAPKVSDVAINGNGTLSTEVFCWDNTHGVQGDIQADAKKPDTVFLYGVASQFNSCESPEKSTPKPGKAVQTYEGDPTQGPAAQLQFPKEQVELINNAANLGYNGLCHVLDENTKSCVKHGYFTPDAQKAGSAIEQLRENGDKIEYPCIGNIPHGEENNTEKVYEMLVAAPAFGLYDVYSHASSQEQKNELEFLAALHGYRAQFQQAIALAQSKGKPVVFKPTAVGLSAFGNHHENVAKAFYVAGKEFEQELKDNNVQVRLQVFNGIGQARYMADSLQLPTEIAAHEEVELAPVNQGVEENGEVESADFHTQFSNQDMKRLNSLLKEHHTGHLHPLKFSIKVGDNQVKYKAWYHPQFDAINIQETKAFKTFS